MNYKRSSWALLSNSYLNTAIIVAKEADSRCAYIALNPEQRLVVLDIVPQLFNCVFNIRHGIELLLKSLIVIQNPNSELLPKFKNHNLDNLLRDLESGENGINAISQLTPTLSGIDFPSSWHSYKQKVLKYQNYSFHKLPKFVSKDVFSKTDKMNMYFRYPDEDGINKALSFLFEGIFQGTGEEWFKSNFIHFSDLQSFTKELQEDANNLIKLGSKIGNSVSSCFPLNDES